ncbi:hypothetical protein Desti_0731 [Desulfomonile tiedjei DSM 6799]|uniref:Uncharacterized protein n=1 Tax=Desulfomonile tiedjei (strain ATCC 49306 / DSM 6799 / DCB-1) TaxID=706587 RepID=I4C1L6_DESTA|nr:hypothetical protein Desti_0731 [Desulfomonile tiedjei DSM 6799]
MVRCAFFFSFILLIASVTVGASQGTPGAYQCSVPVLNHCAPSRPAPPITRTVQVDVPVPCVPICGPAMPHPSQPCAPPVCALSCPTQPVQVRVDVIVRPAGPQPCPPPKCENPPVFEPFFCQAAGMIRSLLVLPLCVGERLMGHPVPVAIPARPCPPPIPACGLATYPNMSNCPPHVQRAPAARPVECVIPARPVSKVAPCGPALIKPFPSHGNSLR